MKQLQLNFQVDEVLLGQVMRNDRKRIIQVFNNIISNSIKFTFSGHINIQITQNIQDQQCLNVECEDSGEGIQDELQPYLFKLYGTIQYKQADTHTHGVGLGLAICSELLKHLGPNEIIKLDSKV